MESSSHAEPQVRPRGAASGPDHRETMRRVFGGGSMLSSCPRVAALGRTSAPARRVLGRVVGLGTTGDLPVKVHKRIRLGNTLALSAAAIMAVWAAVEALFGDRSNLLWELGFLAGFMSVLGLNAIGRHRVARLLGLLTGNLCVFAGAVLFTDAAGGVLPFFAMTSISLLLFGADEWPLAIAGAGIPVLLFAVCQAGLAADLLSIQPRPAPGWYFAANAVSTFALAFLVPFFFFRANARAEASLERIGQEKLKRLLDADLIGVVRGRLSGRIEDANDTFLSLLGFTRPDLDGGALDLEMIAPADPFGTEVHRRGPTWFYERSCVRKDGTRVPTLIGVAVLDESDDEVVAFVLDLTPQKNLEAERAMLYESQEALRLRDLFNSIASHELKTPLTALLLQLGLLRRRVQKELPAGSSLPAHLDRCDSAAKRMAELIDTLLDVARIHRGRLTLEVRDTDVTERARRVLSGFDLGREEGARRISLHADGPVSARVDPVRFDQVVTNLLSNALKYGAGKPIEVWVRHDRAVDAARLEVVDGGPGIDRSMTERIFEPFQRAPTTEPIPGLGLGLYVVKLIVEGHGGRITVDSEPGRGSRFIVDLPCGGAAQPLLH